MSSLDAFPRYYAHMGPLNLAGGVAVDLSPAAPVDPVEIVRRIHRGEWVVDIRPRSNFAAGHVVGTIGIELDDGFATSLAWLAPWGMPITLLADTAEQIEKAQRQLVRVGIDRPAAAPTAASTLGQRLRVAQLPTGHVRRPATDATVIDVRRPSDYDERHLSGAIHLALHELLDRLDEVPEGELFVHSASGYRASIAASLLDRSGHDVVLVDDEF